MCVTSVQGFDLIEMYYQFRCQPPVPNLGVLVHCDDRGQSHTTCHLNQHTVLFEYLGDNTYTAPHLDIR